MYTLGKRHKLCNVTAIDALFAHRSGGEHINADIHSSLAYPLRAVWRERHDDSHRHPGAAPVQFLISIPKRRLKHAVDRVTMRRRVREAYRLARPELEAAIGTRRFDITFIYVADTLQPYRRIERAMSRLLASLAKP